MDRTHQFIIRPLRPEFKDGHHSCIFVKDHSSQRVVFSFNILKKRLDLMDIQSLYDKIGQYALMTQNVESFTIGDPYTVWNSLHMTYGAFNVNLNYVRRVENYNLFNMTFYYGGKLKNDSSNVYEEQSNGFNAIINVIRHLKDELELDDYAEITIYPFWQKFSDLLAGAYADINIYVPVEDICEDYDKQESDSE